VIHREANYQLNWDHPQATFRGAAGVRVAGAWYAASFGPLVGNTWYYLAATYDGQTLRAYTNGALVTSTATAGGPADADPDALAIGRHAVDPNFFAGVIDNVRIYGAALSQAAIQSDMNTPLGTGTGADTTPPTVAITSPSSGATYTATSSPLTLGGR
jgi:hypothetical protein